MTRPAHQYLIATHDWLPGVRLSLKGGWGNVPYATDAQAEKAARFTAGGDPMVIERRRFAAKLPPCDLPE